MPTVVLTLVSSPPPAILPVADAGTPALLNKPRTTNERSGLQRDRVDHADWRWRQPLVSNDFAVGDSMKHPSS